MLCLTGEIRMRQFLNSNKKISRSSLKSLFSHIDVFKYIIITCAWFNFDSKFFRIRDNLFSTTGITFSSNYLSFSLTSGTLFLHHVVISPSNWNSFSFFSLTIAFLTSYNIVLVLCSWTLAMRTSHILKDSGIKLFSIIQIFQSDS